MSMFANVRNVRMGSSEKTLSISRTSTPSSASRSPRQSYVGDLGINRHITERGDQATSGRRRTVELDQPAAGNEPPNEVVRPATTSSAPDVGQPARHRATCGEVDPSGCVAADGNATERRLHTGQPAQGRERMQSIRRHRSRWPSARSAAIAATLFHRTTHQECVSDHGLAVRPKRGCRCRLPTLLRRVRLADHHRAEQPQTPDLHRIGLGRQHSATGRRPKACGAGRRPCLLSPDSFVLLAPQEDAHAVKNICGESAAGFERWRWGVQREKIRQPKSGSLSCPPEDHRVPKKATETPAASGPIMASTSTATRDRERA